MFTNNTETLRLCSLLVQARTALGEALALAIGARASEIGAYLMEAVSRVEEVCAALDLPHDDWPEPITYTAHERRLLFEGEEGSCPVCGRPRGFSVPDRCDDNIACPEPEDIERSLQP